MSNGDATYLDYNATSPLRRGVLQAMLPWLEAPANASSAHVFGRLASNAVERAREQVAQLVGARPSEVLFTSGATESINTVHASWPGRVIVSAAEHPAAFESGSHRGARVIGLDRDGRASLAEARALLSDDYRPSTTLLSLMLANNETGVINDLASATGLARAFDAVVHTDATQAVGRIDVGFDALGVDYLSLSSHKFGGPQGVGALVVRRDAPPVGPLLRGGHQERGRRSGTLNVAGIVGMGAAAALALAGLDDQGRTQGRMRDAFEAALMTLDPAVTFFGRGTPRLPNTSCFSFDGVPADAVMAGAPQVAVSHGSACASARDASSPTLSAMGATRAQLDGALRMSLGPETLFADVLRSARLLHESAVRVRSALVGVA